MFQRFTGRARSAVVAAREEAVAAGAATIGAHHLLLGVLRDPDALATRVVADLDVDLRALRAELVRRGADQTSPSAADALTDEDVAALRTIGIDAEEVLRRVAVDLGGLPGRPAGRAGAGGATRGRLPLSADGKKALELGLREAVALKHGYIGTEHLLLGLLRGRAPVVAAACDAAGLRHGEVRDAVVAALRTAG